MLFEDFRSTHNNISPSTPRSTSSSPRSISPSTPRPISQSISRSPSLSPISSSTSRSPSLSPMSPSTPRSDKSSSRLVSKKGVPLSKINTSSMKNGGVDRSWGKRKYKRDDSPVSVVSPSISSPGDKSGKIVIKNNNNNNVGGSGHTHTHTENYYPYSYYPYYYNSWYYPYLSWLYPNYYPYDVRRYVDRVDDNDEKVIYIDGGVRDDGMTMRYNAMMFVVMVIIVLLVVLLLK